MLKDTSTFEIHSVLRIMMLQCLKDPRWWERPDFASRISKLKLL